METFNTNEPPVDVIKWDVVTLHRAGRLLRREVDFNPIPRQREVADKFLGRVAFEMWARRHHDTPEEAILGIETTVEDNQVA
jgi:hypothetical protein